MRRTKSTTAESSDLTATHPAPDEIDAFSSEMEGVADWVGQAVCRGIDFHDLLIEIVAVLPGMMPSLFGNLTGKGAKQAKAQLAGQLGPIISFSLWNVTPQPDHGFQPTPAKFPGGARPCVCGSGQPLRDCCLAVLGREFMVEEGLMLYHVIRHLPAKRLSEVPRLPEFAEAIAAAADSLARRGRIDDALSLLEPLFVDLKSLDGRAETASDILLGLYDHVGTTDKKQALLARLKSAPDVVLRSSAWQREASIHADGGDTVAAWECFRTAAGLTPDAPSLSHLEVLLLLCEGRKKDAAARARHWIGRLGDSPEHADLCATLEILTAHGEVFEAAAKTQRAAKKKVPPAKTGKSPRTPSRPACAGRLQLKVQIDQVKPAVWRRVVVNDNLSFGELHRVIQIAFGWDDCHLHQFDCAGRLIGPPEVGDDPFADEEVAAEDALFLQGIGADLKKFKYCYDFGDDWRHTITIEKRLPADPSAPPVDLLAGKNACPPEDSGGPWGYADILATLARGDDESGGLVEWLGDHDPTEFDLEGEREYVRQETEHYGRVKAAPKRSRAR